MTYARRRQPAAELGVRQLPWGEDHPVNGWNPDFSRCSRGSVHPGTPNSAAVPMKSLQLIDITRESDFSARCGPVLAARYQETGSALAYMTLASAAMRLMVARCTRKMR